MTQIQEKHYIPLIYVCMFTYLTRARTHTHTHSWSLSVLRKDTRKTFKNITCTQTKYILKPTLSASASPDSKFHASEIGVIGSSRRGSVVNEPN